MNKPDKIDLPGQTSRDPFVGRNRELSALLNWFNAEAPEPSSVIVEGPAGIGKTRLVDEFIAHVDDSNALILRGHNYQGSITGPYFTFVQILSQLDGSSFPYSEHEPTLTQDSGTVRAGYLRELTSAVIESVSGARTLIWIEDIQWADVGSLLLLNTLLDEEAVGISVICTTRTGDPMEPEVEQLYEKLEQKSHRITLEELASAETRQLIESLAEPGEISREEIPHLHRAAGGNPMFTLELFWHVRRTGLLARHTLAETLTRSGAPDRLANAIDGRLLSLPKAAADVLPVCAVIGMESEASSIAEILGQRAADIEDALDVCTDYGILERADSPAGGTYRFTHALYRMRIYDKTRASIRRRLHRQVAEAGISGTFALSAERLAHHYAIGHGANAGRRGVSLCRSAAEDAERLLAYETAARLWELAIACTRPHSGRLRAELFRRLGWALWAAGKWNQAAHAWHEATTLFDQLGDLERLAEISLALGDIYRWRLELLESEQWLTRALELLPKESVDRARALALLGSIRCIEDRPAEGLRLLETAQRINEANNRCDPMVAFWLSFGVSIAGDVERARAIATTCLDEVGQNGALRGVSLLASNLVLYELISFQPSAARSYAQVVEDTAGVDDTTAYAQSMVCRAWIEGYAGNWSRVARVCEEWMARVRLAGEYQVATARVMLAEAVLSLGNPEAACSEIQRALPGLENMQPTAGIHLARAYLRLGEADAAESLVRQYAEEVLSRTHSVGGAAILSDVVGDLELPDLWDRCYERLRGDPRRMALIYCPISTQRVLGKLAWRLHDWKAAELQFQEAALELDRGQARWELAQTHLNWRDMRLVRRRRGDATKAQANQLQANAILESLNIEPVQWEDGLTLSRDGNRFSLTGREIEVLSLVAEGQRSHEIAAALCLSRRTVDRHIENVCAKVGTDGRTEAVVIALEEGIVGPFASQRGAMHN